MSCDLLIPFDSSCCDISIVPDELQVMTANYYDCASEQIQQLITSMYAAEAFGNEDQSEAFANAINDYHYLYGYLVMIYYQRLEDADLNSPCFTDKGVPFYIQDFEIACIKRYFECTNINIIPLLQAFDLVISGDPDGINFISIEQVQPVSIECPQNDQLFIVNKQL